MMVIEPKIRGFMCTTAHPQGCKANIDAQIQQVRAWAEAQDVIGKPKRVLIIGGSAGYGLSSRILCAAGYGATTLSVSMEKAPKEKKTATAGWYNNHYLEQWAAEQGIDAYSLFGDAFSEETKQHVVDKIRDTMQQVDLVVYSLAAPRRVKCQQGEPVTYQSVIKPIGQTIDVRTVDTASGQMKQFELAAASEQEIENTVAVMGGEDWFDWMNTLNQEGLLSDQIQTVAFSYLGGELTKAIYGAATLGAAKEDVEHYCQRINKLIVSKNSESVAKVAVLKAIVTQSSAAIPSLPLYISVLYQVMKSQGNHEGCLDQIIRLFETGLYPQAESQCSMDKPYRYRLDDKELQPAVQNAVTELWQQVSEANLESLTDFNGYRSDFLKLFGFDWPEVDYQQGVSPIP